MGFKRFYGHKWRAILFRKIHIWMNLEWVEQNKDSRQSGSCLLLFDFAAQSNNNCPHIPAPGAGWSLAVHNSDYRWQHGARVSVANITIAL